MDFSVILPTYNNLELFRRAIDSVVQQQGVTTEIIVVDDSTTDDIENFITNSPPAPLGPPNSEGRGRREEGRDREVCHHVRYHRNRPPLGAVNNWNAGLQLASAPHILVLHHDEQLPSPTFLRDALQALRTHDVVVADAMVHTSARSYRLAPPLLKHLAVQLPWLLFVANLIGPCACVAFRSHCALPFDARLRWLVDVDWYHRMLRHRRRTYLPHLTVHSHHGHEQQITAQIDPHSCADADLCILRTTTYRHSPLVLLSLLVYRHIVHRTTLRHNLKRLIRR